MDKKIIVLPSFLSFQQPVADCVYPLNEPVSRTVLKRKLLYHLHFKRFSVKNRVVMQEQQGRLGKLPNSSGKQPVTAGEEIYPTVKRFISRVC